AAKKRDYEQIKPPRQAPTGKFFSTTAKAPPTEPTPFHPPPTADKSPQRRKKLRIIDTQTKRARKKTTSRHDCP
ncbi:hypothetical protein, partial [Thauera phenolivorans]|uniref:hypothetical protein n=1 Tax=Thauera phenolivorans TaxID=1792543 RepID=UPI001E4DCEAE